MSRLLVVVGEASFECPSAVVLRVLHDIRQIARYEPKLLRVRVRPASDAGGTYRGAGLFAGLPWAGTFDYRLTPRGFESSLLGKVGGVAVRGGFTVRDIGEARSQIVHREEYRFPSWNVPFRLLARGYLPGAMRRELRALARIAGTSCTDLIVRCASPER